VRKRKIEKEKDIKEDRKEGRKKPIEKKSMIE